MRVAAFQTLLPWLPPFCACAERAAMSQPGPRAAPPTLEELRAAAKQLGEVVDATGASNAALGAAL